MKRRFASVLSLGLIFVVAAFAADDAPKPKQEVGRVFIRFIVNEDRKPTDVKFLNSTGDVDLEEAVKAISKWLPRDAEIGYRMQVPVAFYSDDSVIVVTEEAPPMVTDPAALSAVKTAEVLIEFLVGEDGKPTEIKVLKSVGDQYSKAAVDAISKWVLKKDQAGKRVQAPVVFRLDDVPPPKSDQPAKADKPATPEPKK